MSKLYTREQMIEVLEEVLIDLKNMYFPEGEDYAELETDWENGQLKVTINFDQKHFEQELKADIETLLEERIESLKNETEETDETE